MCTGHVWKFAFTACALCSDWLTGPNEWTSISLSDRVEKWILGAYLGY
jgi:hypothetical protein